MSAYINTDLIEIEDSLPDSYEKDRLVLLPRDPHWLFAYWDISKDTREKIHLERERQRTELQFYLRIHRHIHSKPGRVESHFDLQVEHNASDWYIQVDRDDHYYHVDWGWQSPGGEFYRALQSNLVCTPRNGISPLIDENWRVPDWKSRKLYRRISLYHLSSPEFMHRRGKRS